MRGKVMYCAMPTRLRHLREDVRKIARGGGYSPVIPFDIGAYEDFEGNPAIGRERTLKFMIHVMRFCDTVGVFGISPGVMGELKAALDYGQDVRVFYGLDPDWEEQYEILKRTEGDLLARLRGPNHLIVLVGPSAVGKTFWSDRLLELFPEWLTRVKTNTTRQPRNAADHASYNFISREEFEHGIKENRFLEYDNYFGNYYGSSMADIRAVLKDRSGILAMTPSGATAVYERRLEINLTTILLVPNSIEVLKTNFRRRGIADSAKQEQLLAAAGNFKLPSHISYWVLSVTGDQKHDQKGVLAILQDLLTPPP